MLRLVPDKRVLCLDWDSRHLRVVLAKCAKDEVRILRVLNERIPPEAGNPQAFGEFIRSVLDRERIGAVRCVLDIPRDQAVLNTLLLPAGTTDDMASMVEFQISKELPFPIDAASVDFVPAPLAEEHEEAVGESAGPERASKATAEKPPIEVLVAAVRNEVLEYYQQVCQAAGLELERVGLRPYANLTALNHLLGENEAGRVLLVDVGPSLTEIDVVRDGRLVFSRAASVGVPEFDAQGRRVAGGEEQSEDAETGRFRVIAGEEEFELETAVADLLVEVNRSIEAYRATDPGAHFSRIVVGGSCGIESRLAETIRRRFETPTQLYDPARKLKIRARTVPPLQAMSPVFGLAIGHARVGVVTFDFLHPKKPGAEKVARRKKIPIIAATVVLFVLAGIVTWWQVIGGPVRAERLQIEKEMREAKAFASKLSKQEEKREEVTKWNSRRVAWVDEIRTLVGLLPGQKEAYLTRLSFDEKGKIDIKMQAKTNDAGTKLAEKLQAITHSSKNQEVPVYSAKVNKTVKQPQSFAQEYQWNTSLEVSNLLINQKYLDATQKKKSKAASGNS